MKEKCFIPLAESVEIVKKVIDMLWDIGTDNNVNHEHGRGHSVSKEDLDRLFYAHKIQGPPTEREYRKEQTRVFLETLDRKMLNSINIVMGVGKDAWAIEKPFENPEKEFEEYAEWLRLEENMHLGKESHINYLITKAPLKKYLQDGLRLLGVA